MRSQHEPDPAREEPVSGLATGAQSSAGSGRDGGPHAAPAGSEPSPADRGKVFPFTPRRHSAQATKNALRDPVRRLDDEEDRRRMRQNVAAALIILMVIGAGFWLIDHLRTNARIAACVEAGHRNCVPLDLSETPGR
jgi:hypothetical protein